MEDNALVKLEYAVPKKTLPTPLLVKLAASLIFSASGLYAAAALLHVHQPLWADNIIISGLLLLYAAGFIFGFAAILRRESRRFVLSWISFLIALAFWILVGFTYRDDQNVLRLEKYDVGVNMAYARAQVVRSDRIRYFTDERLITILPVLSQMHRLRSLDLSDTSITDSSLSRLGTLSIDELDLAGTTISLGGLHELKKMPNLHVLILDDKQLMSADLDSLQREFPAIDIYLLKDGIGPLNQYTKGPARYQRVPP